MRGSVSTILDLCERRPGQGFLWLALLWASGTCLLAQGQGVGLPAGAVSRDFPKAVDTSPSPAIKRLEETFAHKDYVAALAEARVLIAAAPADNPHLDTLLYIEGVSLYFSGRHEEAQLPLDRHRADFPGGNHAERIHYYAGSNLLKRSCWRAAGNVLDDFMEDYPESSLMDYALYDRATVDLALDEHRACFSRVKRLEEGFPNSGLIDRAAFLKGEVLKRSGDMAQSESAFIMAKNIAHRQGHLKVAAHALCRLIEVSFQQGRYDDSADYYDAFFLSYPMSPRALEAAAAGLPALKALGRIMFGLNRMEDLIITRGNGVQARRLHAALKIYTSYFSEVHGCDELLKRYRDLSSVVPEHDALHEALIVARLEVLETYFTGRDAEVEVFYDEIRSRIGRDHLSAYLIQKIARHVSRYDNGESVLWLSGLLERPDLYCRDEVIVALAVARTACGGAGRIKLAREGLESFLGEYGSPELMERAVLELARVSECLQDWQRARQCWLQYLSRPDWQSARGEALKGMARLQQLPGARGTDTVVHQASGFHDDAATGQVEERVTEVGGMLSSRIESAEKLMRSGFNQEALEILGRVVMDGGRISEPDADVTALIRRAGILRENLQFELKKY